MIIHSIDNVDQSFPFLDDLNTLKKNRMFLKIVCDILSF